MENRRGNEIFLGVVGVATLLVAIIGATFAYFSASAQSGNEAINTSSAQLQLGYADDPGKLSTNLIPSSNTIALFTATDKNWIDSKETQFKGDDGKTITVTGHGLCKDMYDNEVCGIYEFTIGNPTTSRMEIEGEVTSVINQFENIWFAVYDETNTQVVTPKKFPQATQSVELTGLEQGLVGSTNEKDNSDFDEKDPTTYTPIVDKSNPANATKETNVRTYKMVIWIQESGNDQTSKDSGKILTASIKFQTKGGAGVTGTIAAADAS